MSQYNRTFQATDKINPPYYYITAHLDLTGLYTGAPESSNPYILYFNRENNYNYLNPQLYPDPDNYTGFYPLDEHSIIGEVAVYANPDLEYTGNLAEVAFYVGGAYKPSVALDTSPINAIQRQSLDVWGGPTGNTPGLITDPELEDGQVCYYGREPAEPTTESTVWLPEWGTRKFLALKYSLQLLNSPRTTKTPKQIQQMIARKAKERVIRPRVVYTQSLPKIIRQLPGADEFTNGKVYVVVKVYPKFEV